MKRQSRTYIVIGLLAACTLAALSTGCSRDPNVRKQKYLESGKHYFAKGKYREAAIQFTNALRIDSGFADAHYQLALCDLKLGSVQNAYAELSRTVQLQPDNLQAELDLGSLFLFANQPQKAGERADYVLSKDPSNVGAHVLKADANAGLRQLDEALAEMNTAVQLDPNRSASYLNLGILETVKSPESPAAESDFKKAIALDNKSVQPRLALASLYDRDKRFTDAEQQLQDAVKVQPHDLKVRTALIAHFLASGQKDAAERAATEAKNALGSDPHAAELLARYYVSVNDMSAARAEYARLAEQFPKDRQIQHTYLGLLIAQGQRDSAMKQVDTILKKFSKDNVALTDKGLLLLEQQKPAEARDVLQTAVKADPQNAMALYGLGNSFKALGDMGQAETQWREAVRVQPAYMPAEKALAELAISRKDVRGLAEIAKTVLEKAPNAPDGYQLQAEVDAINNDAKSAEEHLLKAISLNPRDARLYLQLGQLRMALHRDSEAEKTFAQALQIDPQQAGAVQSLVQVYLRESKPEKAMTLARDTVTKFPQDGPAHVILGELAASQQELDVAESELTKAVDEMPHAIGVYSQLADVQAKRKEGSRAVDTFNLAAKNNPNDPAAFWMLGALQEQQHDLGGAEKSYRKALELKPDFGPAANNLAYLMLQRDGNIDEVITYAEIARRQMPEVPAVADTLGWAYYQKGTPALAVEMLQDAVKAMPNRALYHYHLGMAYSKSGDRQHAKSELQKALELSKGEVNSDDVRRTLSSIG